ncbi:MAG: hypothetical protein NT177_08750, partial [Chloroflexi bacterium]|nr:hypothetical protein [Chloroflexota bacterium]
IDDEDGGWDELLSFGLLTEMAPFLKVSIGCAPLKANTKHINIRTTTKTICLTKSKPPFITAIIDYL